MNNGSKEVVEGYVVDLACIRKYPRSELAERARAHTRECVLMPHCIESGYGLVDEEGGLCLLDPAATPLILDAVRSASRDKAIRLRAIRQRQGEEMHTTSVEEV